MHCDIQYLLYATLSGYLAALQSGILFNFYGWSKLVLMLYWVEYLVTQWSGLIIFDAIHRSKLGNFMVVIKCFLILNVLDIYLATSMAVINYV